ncbi:PREDICTED: uncharacterized protein LOC105622761 [Atta cephalotes]|uniref:Uncharacterized protein n=2 Tax=Atta TaxID=12956 RepID=A0A158NPV5_ATTCE|nr:PREDICTED: uncharacterized protein LOC105622761 [Atta cephalotes]XP_018058242.1 PREDICTED: uncharacterized protein LOC108693693 [Atta colombica]KYM75485.1 hypothetical protein ALC53_14181 [Atta colombica]
MRPDSRSVSFTFHREVLSVQNSPEMVRSSRNLRQRLQDRFEKDRGSSNNDAKEKPQKTKDSTDRPWNNISLGNVSADSRRALRNGAEKLSRTISSVRTTFGTISQKFKSSTRRRQRLEEQQSPSNMQTPQTRSRQLLGRTPTKLYSPFGIESPRHAWNKENEISTPVRAVRASSPECNMRYIHCRPFRFTKVKGFSMLR